jgi:hypothetical protein
MTVDKNYGLMLVNFKNLVYMGNQITDELYVLTSQVEQVVYVEDKRNPNWTCAAMIKSRNVYDVGQGQGHDDDEPNYYESEPFLLDHNQHCNPYDDLEYARTNLAPIEVSETS